MTVSPEEIDQQRRVINSVKQSTMTLVDALDGVQRAHNTYQRLGLGDDEILQSDAFSGTGTNISAFRDAVASLEAFLTLLDEGHGTNLERLVR